MNHMLTQTLNLLQTRYVIRPKPIERDTDQRSLLDELARLRDQVSREWRGNADAVKEIRDQRGGDL